MGPKTAHARIVDARNMAMSDKTGTITQPRPLVSGAEAGAVAGLCAMAFVGSTGDLYGLSSW
jgi:hypothetical protein